jgi:hypothetical protein
MTLQSDHIIKAIIRSNLRNIRSPGGGWDSSDLVKGSNTVGGMLYKFETPGVSVLAQHGE